jgi:hypothetical protein
MIRDAACEPKPNVQLATPGLVTMACLAHTFRLNVQVLVMFFPLRTLILAAVCLPVGLNLAAAADAMIVWPSDWQVEALPESPSTPDQPTVQIRQRAVKNDQNGDPAMVVELTQTRLQPGHDVNVQGVLLEMRKAVQVNFVRSGFQSVCTKMKDSTLSEIPAMETTCTITQNGAHVMTQTLVAAANKEMAWSLSYAGSADGYAANKEEVLRIRDSLRLDVAP